MELDSYPEVSLADLSGITHSYHIAPSGEPGRVALIIRFTGQYGVGCKGNGDAVYMRAVASAGLEPWHPNRSVFDFRELEYVWGDMLDSVLRTGQGRVSVMELLASGKISDSKNMQAMDIPTAVVVSDKCRKAVTSLLVEEMLEELTKWLFDSLEAALGGGSSGVDQSVQG
jgi:hypothetical protein